MNVLISGASTGIGRATAIHLARLGHTLWSGVRTQEAFDEIGRLRLRGLQPVFLDVTDSASIEAALGTIKKKAGMLNALINNAGIAVGGPIEGLTMADWRRQFDINFFGTIELTKACLPLLREAKGRIINISSISGRLASPYLSPYAASKFALEAFSDSLRREMRPYDVKVCVIEPGAIKTPIWAKSRLESLDRKTQLPAEIIDLYGSSIDRFLHNMEKVELTASPVALVTKAITHALCSRSPHTRYPVGRGVRFITHASGILPDTWLDRLLRTRA